MADSQEEQKATHALLHQLFSDYNTRLSLNSSSKILTSTPTLAASITSATSAIQTSYGPSITIASEAPLPPNNDNTTTIPLTDLQMDTYTHAILALSRTSTPSSILQTLKVVLYALRPKGVAIVIAPMGTGVEERIREMSRGKADGVRDVVEWAGFERGKIRGVEVEAEVEGEKVKGEVVLGMKWDQLTA